METIGGMRLKEEPTFATVCAAAAGRTVLG